MSNNEERLNVRLSKKQKDIAGYAASLLGRSLSDFVRSSVEKEARETIKDYKVIELSRRDSKAFLETLANPPEPNQSLREAAETHEELIGE